MTAETEMFAEAQASTPKTGLRMLGPFDLKFNTPGLKEVTGTFLFTPQVGDFLVDAFMFVRVPMVTVELNQGPTLQFGTWADAGDRLFGETFDCQADAATGTDLLIPAGSPIMGRAVRGDTQNQVSVDGPDYGDLAFCQFTRASAVRARLSDDNGDPWPAFNVITDTLNVGHVQVWFLVITPEAP